ncbi:MAG: OB-fold nucleic acid binding domain-containing protein [bacterium]|nr:OB-fold nucleic acid binding domain-containing protein [bacterium]
MSEPPSQSPGLQGLPEETLCPSCGNFVGAYVRCPYCGAEHRRRMSIRFFRIFSMVVSLGGVFLIWLAARGIESPLIKVRDIQPLNAFAYVRVEGEVTRSSSYADGGVSFTVDDGTGTIQVRAYGETGKEMAAAGRVPSAGDRVTAEGTLNFRGGHFTMIVNLPEKVHVRRVDAPTLAIASLGQEHIERKVKVQGTVTGALEFGKGTTYTLSDGVGTIDVVLWHTRRDIFGDRLRLLEPGRQVSVQGRLGEYRGKLQITLDFPGDLREAGPPAAPAAAPASAMAKIGDISRETLKREVVIAGTVVGLRSFSRGTALELADPTGKVEVVVWDSLRRDLPRADDLLKEGAILRVRGIVGEYRDRLQVVPKSAAGIEETTIAE